MKNKFTLILLIFCITSSDVFSQKIITNYWPRTKVIGEQYQIDGYGVKNGFYKEFNQYGTIIRHFNYADGQENGLCIEYITMRGGEYYDCKGKPMVEKMMKAGDVIYEKEFTCSGGGYYMFRKREANKNGIGFTYTEYFPSGKISKIYGLTFNLDKLGPYTDYYENGSVKESGNYLKTQNYNSLMNGHFYAIGEKRDTQYSVWFDKNYPVIGRFYHENGKVKNFIKLSNDYESQIIRQHDEAGNLIRSAVYRAYPLDMKCANNVVAKNRKDAMNIGDDCMKDLFNPYDLDIEKNNNQELIYLEVDSTFENASLKSVEKWFPYSYKNEFGKVIRGSYSEDVKNQIEGKNALTNGKNQFYRDALAMVTYLNSKYVINNSVTNKHIYNSYCNVIQDFIFGDLSIIRNKVTKTSDPRLSQLYASETHFLENASEYYTDYLKLYASDSLYVFFNKLKNLNTPIVPGNAKIFELDGAFNMANLKEDTEYEGTYCAAGIFYKPSEIVPVRNTGKEVVANSADFFKGFKSSIDKISAQEDTKDLEKQLKATKDPKVLRQLLGI